MAVPDTSPYVLVEPGNPALTGSRVLAASGGLEIRDTGPTNFATVSTIAGGKLENLNAFNTGGFVNFNSTSQQFVPITFASGTGIAISSPDGQSGATSISVLDDKTIQKVQIQKGITSGEPGAFVGNASVLNFIPGENTSITASFNPLPTGRVDIQIGTSTSFAPESAKYIIQTPDAGLPDAQPLSPLSTGLMKVTTGTGAISTAIPDTDYQSANIHLTSISSTSAAAGELLVGTGITFGGITPGPAGTVLTSTGTLSVPSWELDAPGYTVDVLSTGTVGPITPSDKTLYVTTSSAGVVIFTLPIIPIIGVIFRISGFGSSGWRINQQAAQTIHLGSVSTTTGVTGHLNSTTRWDAVDVICIDPNNFLATPIMGNPNAF